MAALLSFPRLHLAAFSLPGDVPGPLLGPCREPQDDRPLRARLSMGSSCISPGSLVRAAGQGNARTHKKKITKSLISACQPCTALNSSITAPSAPPSPGTARALFIAAPWGAPVLDEVMGSGGAGLGAACISRAATKVLSEFCTAGLPTPRCAHGSAQHHLLFAAPGPCSPAVWHPEPTWAAPQQEEPHGPIAPPKIPARQCQDCLWMPAAC